jgi:two-component system CheB/CheR fusion protein
MSTAEDVDLPTDAALGAILRIVHERTSTDFSRYRPSTVARRVRNRMIFVGASSFEHYLNLLRDDHDEALRLLERITIKVSRFYRNRVTFDPLRFDVLPALARARPGGSLRIWSAGCGCGEEPHTLAMLLEEAGLDGVIEATDIDAQALERAAAGQYSDDAFAELPEPLRDRYCERSSGGYVVRPALRERIRFSRHDLTSSLPPPRKGEPFDLICCRNVMIYFEREVQEHAMRMTRSALREGGFLCLGKAEWPLPSVAGSLEAFLHKARIFRAVGSTPLEMSHRAPQRARGETEKTEETLCRAPHKTS